MKKSSPEVCHPPSRIIAPAMLLFPLILATIICDSCRQTPNPYYLENINPEIVKELRSFINTYNQVRDEYIVKLIISSNDCRGTEIILTAGLPCLSTILEYPASKYTIVEGKLVLIFSGEEILQWNNLVDYEKVVFQFFPIQGLKDDWDEVKHESESQLVYDPPFRGVRFKNDSISYFRPENAYYFHPGLPCPNSPPEIME